MLIQPKDYGINGFLPKGTLQLIRFLLFFFIVNTSYLLSFFRFSFEKYSAKPERLLRNRTEEIEKAFDPEKIHNISKMF